MEEDALSDLDMKILEGAVEDYRENGNNVPVILVMDADFTRTTQLKVDAVHRKLEQLGIAVTIMSREDFNKLHTVRPDLESVLKERLKQVVCISNPKTTRSERVPHMQRGGLEKWRLPR